MRRKGLEGAFLYCVVNDLNGPWIFTGFLCEVNDAYAVIADSGLNRVNVGGHNVRFSLHNCFFTREGAERYIEYLLKWRERA